MEENMKIVHFDEYCKTCKHSEKKDKEEPCAECLENPGNVHSHKPVRWGEK